VKWASYEHDEAGITTEDAGAIALMHEKRLRKRVSLRETLRGLRTVNRFGSGRRTIVTYGSTTMSVLEAVSVGGIGDVTVVQPLYLEPFPEWEFQESAGSDAVVVEQSCSAQLATLLQHRTQVNVTKTITQYDGRPFDPEDLAERLKGVLGDG